MKGAFCGFITEKSPEWWPDMLMTSCHHLGVTRDDYQKFHLCPGMSNEVRAEPWRRCGNQSACHVEAHLILHLVVAAAAIPGEGTADEPVYSVSTIWSSSPHLQCDVRCSAHICNKLMFSPSYLTPVMMRLLKDVLDNS